MCGVQDVTSNVNTLDYSRTRFGQAMLPPPVYMHVIIKRTTTTTTTLTTTTAAEHWLIVKAALQPMTVECFNGTMSRCTAARPRVLRCCWRPKTHLPFTDKQCGWPSAKGYRARMYPNRHYWMNVMLRHAKNIISPQKKNPSWFFVFIFLIYEIQSSTYVEFLKASVV